MNSEDENTEERYERLKRYDDPFTDLTFAFSDLRLRCESLAEDPTEDEILEIRTYVDRLESNDVYKGRQDIKKEVERLKKTHLSK